MMQFLIVSAVSHMAAALATSKLQKQPMLAGAGMSALGGALGAVAAAAGTFVQRPPKPKPPGPKDWSPRRRRSCLCPDHAE